VCLPRGVALAARAVALGPGGVQHALGLGHPLVGVAETVLRRLE
jgi:hypothetical protein